MEKVAALQRKLINANRKSEEYKKQAEEAKHRQVADVGALEGELVGAKVKIAELSFQNEQTLHIARQQRRNGTR